MICATTCLASRRRNGVPGTTLSHDTLRMLDAITDAASRPPAPEPQRTARAAAESRLRRWVSCLPSPLPIYNHTGTVRGCRGAQAANVGCRAARQRGGSRVGRGCFLLAGLLPLRDPRMRGSRAGRRARCDPDGLIGGIEYPVVWNSNQPVVTMPREIRQVPARSGAILQALAATGEGAQITSASRGKGCSKYERGTGRMMLARSVWHQTARW